MRFQAGRQFRLESLAQYSRNDPCRHLFSSLILQQYLMEQKLPLVAIEILIQTPLLEETFW